MQVEANPGTHGCTTAAKQGPLTRQVFISHAGKDEGARNFAASVLKPALEAAGLPVYMDFANLEPGCEWPEQLVEAAANSAVVVVVLSKHYTQRYWCMLELDLARHSRSSSTTQQQQQQQHELQQPLVIPVFYDDKSDIVKPDEIKQYWQHNTSATRKEWVDPQRWAENIYAMKERLQYVSRSEFEATKNADYQLARRVVATAATAMPVTLHVEGVLGAEEQEARLIAELVVPDPDRLGLWLHGCGGLGKTTMARLLYNRLQTSHFQHHHAYVELRDDVEISSQQLSDVLSQLGAMGFQQGDSAAGMLQKLEDYVQNRTVLLVVDNVWTAEQLDKLLPRAFGQGSRVIITSRSARMPSSDWWKQVKQHVLQRELGVLSEEAALALFRQSADLDLHFPMPRKEHRDAEQAIVKICGGLPLALKLTGSLLHCTEPNNLRPLEHWEAALEALQKGMNAVDTDGRLKGILSKHFSSLQQQQQHMLLDVATVLRGQPKHLALAVWCSWHGNEAVLFYEGLERCNLINTDGEGLMQMHDVLAALGRGILFDPSTCYYGSRVWMQGDRLMGVQKGHPVLAAQLDDTIVTSADLSLTDWSQVRILLMADSRDDSEPASNEPLISKKVQSPNLLWLQMACPDVFAWQHSSRESTRQLGSCGFLSGCCRYLQDVFAQEHSAIPTKLCVLQLYFQPDRACCKLTALTKSIDQLANLQYLVLNWCSSLTSLPESLGQLRRLQQLDLCGCYELTSLPESLGQLSRLQQLSLYSCCNLTSLPESLGQLSGLQQLELSECTLTSLPESVGQMSGLQQLDLSWCESLTSLPESLGQLSCLVQLNLSNCKSLTSLPESLGQLSGLQQLELSGCSLTSLPESLGQLSCLQGLDLHSCNCLTSLTSTTAAQDAEQQLQQQLHIDSNNWQHVALQRLQGLLDPLYHTSMYELAVDAWAAALQPLAAAQPRSSSKPARSAAWCIFCLHSPDRCIWCSVLLALLVNLADDADLARVRFAATVLPRAVLQQLVLPAAEMLDEEVYRHLLHAVEGLESGSSSRRVGGWVQSVFGPARWLKQQQQQKASAHLGSSSSGVRDNSSATMAVTLRQSQNSDPAAADAGAAEDELVPGVAELLDAVKELQYLQGLNPGVGMNTLGHMANCLYWLPPCILGP